MPDYKTLYFKLFSAMAEVIEALQETSLEAESLVMNEDKDSVALAEKLQNKERYKEKAGQS